MLLFFSSANINESRNNSVAVLFRHQTLGPTTSISIVLLWASDKHKSKHDEMRANVQIFHVFFSVLLFTHSLPWISINRMSFTPSFKSSLTLLYSTYIDGDGCFLLLLSIWIWKMDYPTWFEPSSLYFQSFHSFSWNFTYFILASITKHNHISLDVYFASFHILRNHNIHLTQLNTFHKIVRFYKNHGQKFALAVLLLCDRVLEQNKKERWRCSTEKRFHFGLVWLRPCTGTSAINDFIETKNVILWLTRFAEQ